MKNKIHVKQQILNVSLQLFAEKGYNGTTTKEIARKCNISEGLIFHYFPKKQDIIYEIFQQLEEKLVFQIGNVLLETDNSIINIKKKKTKREKYIQLKKILKNIVELILINLRKNEFNLIFRVLLNSMMVLDQEVKFRIVNKIHQSLWIPVSLKIKEYLPQQVDEYMFFRLVQSSFAGFIIFQNFFEWEKVFHIDYNKYVDFAIDCIVNGLKEYEKN
jgi:AcrR family transcriptional regulator